MPGSGIKEDGGRVLMIGINALQNINRKGRVIDDGGRICLGTGVSLANNLRSESKPKPLYLNAVERAGHFGCFGTTRIGKTRLLSNLITQDIKGGRNVIVIDPKGDHELFSAVVQSAAESGRLEELMLVTPIFPEFSLRIDPLAYYYMPDELVDHVVSGIRAKEEYFINVASEISTVIVLGMIALAKARGEKPRLNFYDIKQRSSRESLEQFRETISMLRDHSDPAVATVAREVCADIAQITASPTDFFAKVSSTLRTTLTALTSSTTGRIIGKTYTNEFVKRFEEGRGVILVCNTGSLLSRRTAHIIGRVLLSMVQSTVGRFFASGKTLKPSLCVYVDEGHNVLYKGIQELFNKGGGAGVWLHFFTQSIAQIQEEIGDEASQSILDNINTWVFMRVNHEKTSKFVEESTPLKNLQQPILSLSGGKMGVSLREVEERLVLKERVVSLPRRWFYMRKEGEMFKGETSMVSDPYVKVKFPAISGVE